MTKLHFLFSIFIFGMALSWGRVEAHLLVLESSDQHSSYDQIPRFVREIYSHRAAFLRQHPDGKVVLVINGDFSGLSEFAQDQGNFNYEMLTRLAHDFELVMNVGNHEGFDWDGAEGNLLFHTQTTKLVEEVSRIQGKPFRLTTANLPLDEKGRGLFSPYRDIPLTPSGKSVRFIGWVLREFFARSNYGVGSSPKIFTGAVLDPVETALNELSRASREGIGSVILAAHDGYMNMAKDLIAIHERMAASPAAWPNIPVACAAHDHLPFRKQVGDTLLVDSGHGYNFHAVALDDSGHVVSDSFVSAGLHALLPPAFHSPHEEWIFNEARRLETVARALHGRVLGKIEHAIEDTRRHLQASRSRLGTALADSLTDWAQKVLEKKMPGESFPVIAFYNSSSYRNEFPIQAGYLTGGTIWRSYPFRSKPRVALVRGSDIAQLFSSLRQYRIRTESNPARQYTPQLSANLAETANYGLKFQKGTELTPLIPDKIYALAMDGWLGANKYNVETWKKIFSRVEWVDTEEAIQTDVLASYLPPRLADLASQPLGCALSTAREGRNSYL